MIVTCGIHIQAPVERVFAFITDFEARARLNPLVTPIRIEIESGGPLQAGAVCHFRLQSGNRVLDYRTHVTEFILNRKVVTVSNTAVPFELCLETVAEDGGTRYTHTELFDPSEAMLLEAAQRAGGNRFTQWLDGVLLFLDPDATDRQHARREALLRQQLEDNLRHWLAAIRQHLEVAPR